MSVEGVLEAGSQAPGHHALMLILAQSVVGIGNLDPVARREQIQVEYILPVGLIVKAVEDGLAVALVVEGGEFRGIQEAAAAHAFQRQEVADPGIAEAAPRRPAGGAEGAVAGVDIAKQPRHAQAGACGDVGHQAALVAKLGIRRTGYHLHALDGTGGKLGRKDFALLVANWLAVDRSEEHTSELQSRQYL